MALLEVKNVKKIYTTRFGNNQVEALKNVNFFSRIWRVCRNYGRVRFGKNNAFKYTGSIG